MYIKVPKAESIYYTSCAQAQYITWCSKSEQPRDSVMMLSVLFKLDE